MPSGNTILQSCPLKAERAGATGEWAGATSERHALPDSMHSLTRPSQATGTGIGLGFQLRVTETQPRLAGADIGIDQFMPRIGTFRSS